MKPKYIYPQLLLFIFYSFFTLNAQSITIGTGTSDTNGGTIDPIDRSNGSLRYQAVYTGSELSSRGLQAGDNLTALGFSVSQVPGASLQNYTIEIGHTTATNASSHINSSTTTVKSSFTYTPTLQNAGNFDMINFDTNFIWNGTDNIFINICTGTNTTNGTAGGVRYTDEDRGARYRTRSSGACSRNTNTRTNLRPNIRFNYTRPACTAPPTGGTTVLTPNSGIPGSAVNGSVTGDSSGAGLTYQWQYSDDGSNWTDISGQTGQTLNTTAINIPGTRHYRRAITCSSQTRHSTPATYTTYATVPATGNNSFTTCSGKLYDSGGPNGNYGNGQDGYTVIHPSIPGNYVSVEGYYNGRARDWLYIYDGEGTGGTLLYSTEGQSNGNCLNNYPIPKITSLSGSLTIRFTSNNTNNCAGFELDISCELPPVCSAPPAGGTTVLSPNSGATESTVNGTVTGAGTGTGLTYQWQYSDDGTNWTDIPGQTDEDLNTIAMSDPGTRQYRRAITCSSQTRHSTPATYTTYATVPATGNNSFTTCSGKLYDSGGPNGNYGNGQDGYTVIHPSIPGNYVSVEGYYNGRARDWLYIYDGEGTGGTLLYSTEGQSNGNCLNNYPIPKITSLSGSLTIRFTSNNTNNCAGFELDISCEGPCSGTPSGGTVTVNPTQGAPGSSYTVSATGYSTGVGITYQWQSNTDGAGWVDEGTASAVYSDFNATAPAQGEHTIEWRLKVYCSNSDETDYSSIGEFNSVLTYCIPTYRTYSSTYFTNVSFLGTLNDFNNPSTYSSNPRGYQDFSAPPTNRAIQTQGGGINIQVKSNYSGQIRAWVDWNQNGQFEQSEMIYETDGVVTSSTMFGFDIPEDAAPGNYRIRIRTLAAQSGSSYYGLAYSDYNACTQFPASSSAYTPTLSFSGEAEDYTFTVIPKCDVSIVSVTDGELCGNSGKAILQAEGTPNTTAFKWYGSEYGNDLLGTTYIEDDDGAWETPNLSNPGVTVFWVAAVSDTCESQHRIAVRAIRRAVPVIEFSLEDPEICGDEDSLESQIQISATGDLEQVYLIEENFDSNGLGVFSSFSESDHSNPDTEWIRRSSIYIPDFPPYRSFKPAISSGISGRGFASCLNDVGEPDKTEESIVLTTAVNTEDFLNLTLSFRLFFFPYFNGNPTGGADEYFIVEISKDNGPWSTVQKYSNPVGHPNQFETQIITLDNEYLEVEELKIRFRMYSNAGPGTGWLGTSAGIANIALYGDKPLITPFNWTAIGSAQIHVYNSDCETPYDGSTEEVCIKPDDQQLEDYSQWRLRASVDLGNGCSASEDIYITNKTKVWNNVSGNKVWSLAKWKPSTSIPTADNCVIIKDNISLHSNVPAEAKNLKITGDGMLDIVPGSVLTVTDWIKNENGADDFIIRTDGNLLQINNDANNNAEIRAERNVTNIHNDYDTQMDYIYWSSPVANQLLKGQNGFSPGTPIGGGYYGYLQYNESNDFFDNTNDTYFLPAKGYAIRAQDGIAYNGSYLYNFTGPLHNGIYDFPVKKDGNGYNLVGNPYPSNIDADIFLDNNTNIYATIYLWTNSVDYDQYQEGSDYSGNNYAVYNKTGGVPGTGEGGNPDPEPNGIINVGQGFIIEKIDPGQENITFDNSIRVKDAGYFYSKGSKDRFWLTLTTPANLVNTTLIGYIDGATNGLEKNYDGLIMGGSDAFYSVLDGNHLAIQGREAPVNIQDVVPLGARFYDSGVHIISLQKTEGVFDQYRIYLIDKDLGYTHNLSKEPYKFFTSNGEFNERFEIRYRTGFTTSANPNFITAATQKEDIIIFSTMENIREVQLFDILGMEVYQNVKVDGRELRIPAGRWMNSVLFARIITEDGEVTTTKVLMK